MKTSSNALINFLRQEIDRHAGKLPFADFMEIVLYHPEWGYYNSKDMDIGKQGDFTTAPEISPLFAQCFAKQCVQIFLHLSQRTILELGAGTGRFAADLIEALKQLGYPPFHYYIYEISPSLRQKQQTYLKERHPDFYQHIKWLDQLPKQMEGVVIANEVLDALPVHRFRIEDDMITEACVAWNNGFVWEYREPSPLLSEKAQQIHAMYALENHYESEINLNMVPFLQSLFKAMQRGVILLVDYGYGREEYYHPQRNHGTLTCFHAHQSHDNPLIYPGLQDITAHVDFTRVAECAVDNDYSVTGYTTQAAFLLACGLLDLAAEAEKGLSPTEEFKLHHAIKTLTMPMEMGERVKVMALSKQLEIALLGFSFQDRRWDL